MPQFVGMGWPDGLGEDLLDDLGDLLARRCAAIPALGVPDTRRYSHFWSCQRGRGSRTPRIMYTTPGLFDLPDRTPQVLELMACVIADTLTQFCLTDPRLRFYYLLAMAYTRSNPTVEQCIIWNPHRLALNAFAAQMEEAGRRRLLYEAERDRARQAVGRENDLATWSDLLGWMGNLFDIFDQTRAAAQNRAHG